MNTILVLGLAIGAPTDAELEKARAVVAVELAKLQLRRLDPTLPRVSGFEAIPVDLDPTKPAPAGYQWIKRGEGPWLLERVAPAVAVPKGSTFPTGGCGCTASANCGATFCKSRGGTGCPQSCPVKQK